VENIASVIDWFITGIVCGIYDTCLTQNTYDIRVTAQGNSSEIAITDSRRSCRLSRPYTSCSMCY